MNNDKSIERNKTGWKNGSHYVCLIDQSSWFLLKEIRSCRHSGEAFTGMMARFTRIIESGRFLGDQSPEQCRLGRC